MNRKSLFAIVALVVSISATIACQYFPESTFELANESRLPKWVAVPDGLTRSDIAITMNYYARPWGETATFIVRDLKNQTETKMGGTVRNLAPIQLKHPPAGFPEGYPAFEVVTVNGITEIIEHRKMEPKFYISDDPVVRKELGVSAKLRFPIEPELSVVGVTSPVHSLTLGGTMSVIAWLQQCQCGPGGPPKRRVLTMTSRACSDRTGKLLALIVGSLMMGMTGCEPAHAPITNTVIMRADNPNRTTAALLVERCHKAALSNEQFYLLLVSDGEGTDKAINDDHIAESSVLVATLAAKVQLRWQDANALLVVCDGCGLEAVDISKRLDHLGSTRVVYQGFPAHTAYS